MSPQELRECVAAMGKAREQGSVTVRVNVCTRPAMKAPPSSAPERQRARYEAYKARQPMTPARMKYGKLKVQARFKKLAEMLGIKIDAARNRYYRGQIPKEIWEATL